MTDDEVLKMYERMQEVFGDELPDPEHEPIKFAYYVKIFKYLYKFIILIISKLLECYDVD